VILLHTLHVRTEWPGRTAVAMKVRLYESRPLVSKAAFVLAWMVVALADGRVSWHWM